MLREGQGIRSWGFCRGKNSGAFGFKGEIQPAMGAVEKCLQYARRKEGAWLLVTTFEATNSRPFKHSRQAEGRIDLIYIYEHV